MKNLSLVSALIAGMLISQLPTNVGGQTPTPANQVLILYDSTSSSQYGKLGLMYSIMLRNLLGHFYMGADIQPVEEYTSGKLESYQTTFYIGALYDNPIPSAFLSDVTQTQRRVVWFKYNLWKMAWDPAFGFNQKYGFSFTDLKGLNAAPSASNPNPGFYDTILYKGRSLVKYYSYDSATGAIKADPDFGRTQIVDPTKAVEVVAARNSGT